MMLIGLSGSAGNDVESSWNGHVMMMMMMMMSEGRRILPPDRKQKPRYMFRTHICSVSNLTGVNPLSHILHLRSVHRALIHSLCRCCGGDAAGFGTSLVTKSAF